MNNSTSTECHVVFIGEVQGVGFRYSTRRFASQYPVSGWVKNKPDGTVEMIAQGDRSYIERLIWDIMNYFKHNIKDTAVEWRPVRESLSGFSITY